MSSPLRRSTSDMIDASFTTPLRQTSLTRHRRAFSDEPSPCPSLLSEYVDEDVEKFMTIPSPDSKTPSCFQQQPMLPLCSRTRKRHQDVEDSPLARRQRSFGSYGDKCNLFSGDESPIPPPKLSRNDPFSQGPFERCDSRSSRDEQFSLLAECEKPASTRKQWPPKQQDKDAFPSLPGFLRSKSSIVEEQRVLLEQIRREQEENKRSKNDDTINHAIRTETSKSHALAKNVQAYQAPIAVGLPSASNIKKKNCVQVCPGKHVRILDRSHAMAALRENKAGLFKCAGCDTLLVASKDSKVLFCAGCGTLTPTSISGNLNSKKQMHK